jgi:hypothetical protein
MTDGNLANFANLAILASRNTQKPQPSEFWDEA